MNESEFENQLRALPPLPPSASLESAISRQLSQAPSPEPEHAARAGELAHGGEGGRIIQLLVARLAWALGGAAATAVCMLAFYHPEPRQSAMAPANTAKITKKTASEAFVPLESSRELLGAENGGVVYDDDHIPREVLSYSSMERHAWSNPVTGARVEVEMPRRDMLLVPVSFQ